MQNNNPLAEISLLVISVVLIAGGVVLMYFGKIDFTALTLIIGFVGALFGVNGALKAPSPSQQAQLIAQHNSLQDLMSQVLNALPALFQKAGAPTPVVVNVQHPADVPTQAQPAVQVSPSNTNAVPQMQFKAMSISDSTGPLAALGVPPK